MLDLTCKDTICAPATANIPSALAIVRVSGSLSLKVKNIIFKTKKKQKNFIATLGNTIQINGCLIDEVLCTFFPKNKSYTGEDSFELSMHGNPILIKKTLKTLIKIGCRLAEPGEFSMRAFLNKKINLCEAEAINDLINAKSNIATQIALKNLKGAIQKTLSKSRDNLIKSISEIEARLDFPDEELGNENKKQILKNLKNISNVLTKLLKKFSLGKQIFNGIKVVLYGNVNVGKSTLLNKLTGKIKSLVHHRPGTTRNIIEDIIIINGIPIKIIDVAGIRDIKKTNEIETMGINLTYKTLEKADIILWIIDGSLKNADYISKKIKNNCPIIKVFNKADIVKNKNNNLWISARTGFGIQNLKNKIKNILFSKKLDINETFITKERQKKEIALAKKSITIAIKALKNNLTQEIIASELRNSRLSLDKLLGKSTDENVLSLIFSKFCIGK